MSPGQMASQAREVGDVRTTLRTFYAQESLLECDRDPLVNRQYSFNAVLTRNSLEYTEKGDSDTKPIVSPLRKPTYSREREEKTYVL